MTPDSSFASGRPDNEPLAVSGESVPTGLTEGPAIIDNGSNSPDNASVVAPVSVAAPVVVTLKKEKPHGVVTSTCGSR
ncbi:hypothetical protein D3C87_2125100 [compost metagenome]